MFVVDGQRIAIPEALGETVGLWGGRRQYLANVGLNLVKSYAAYGELYRRQLWVGVVVRKRANALARLPLRFHGDDDELTSLFTNTPGMNPYTLARWIQATSDIYGEALLLKVRVNGVVTALLPMHPSKVEVVVTADENDAQVVEYWFSGNRAGAPTFRFDRSEVIHFKEYNPDDLWRGVSVLESLRETLSNEDASRRATQSFWDSGARPGMVVEHPLTLSDTAAKRLGASIEANHAGGDKAGRTLVLEEGAVAKIIQLSAEEMQYIESRKLNREEVCAGYDTPPPVVHILDHATFSNITEQMRSMYRDTMTPPIQLIEATLLDQLIKPDFPHLYDRGVTATIDISGVLRGDWESRVTAVAAAIQNSLLTPSEGRAILDLPEIDDPNADELYANAALTRLDSPARMAEPPAPPVPPVHVIDATATEAPPAPPAPLALRSLMGRLGSVKTDIPALTDALVAEHRAVFLKFVSGVRDQYAVDDLVTDLAVLSAAAAKSFANPMAAECPVAPLVAIDGETPTDAADRLARARVADLRAFGGQAP